MVEGLFEIGLFNTILAVVKAYVSSPKIVNVILKFTEELVNSKSTRISPQRNSTYNFVRIFYNKFFLKAIFVQDSLNLWLK